MFTTQTPEAFILISEVFLCSSCIKPHQCVLAAQKYTAESEELTEVMIKEPLSMSSLFNWNLSLNWSS